MVKEGEAEDVKKAFDGILTNITGIKKFLQC